MSAFSDALSVSSSGLRAQATRLRVVSENIANVDTPGYHRKTLSFEPTGHSRDAVQQVEVGHVRLDRSDLEQVYDEDLEAKILAVLQARQNVLKTLKGRRAAKLSSCAHIVSSSKSWTLNYTLEE